MRYRLLVLDVDGTLLDSNHALRPRVIQAVRVVRAAGLGVTLATGKLLRSVLPILGTLGLDGPQITLNGAATCDARTGAVARFAPLAEDARRATITAVRAVDGKVLLAHFTRTGAGCPRLSSGGGMHRRPRAGRVH